MLVTEIALVTGMQRDGDEGMGLERVQARRWLRRRRAEHAGQPARSPPAAAEDATATLSTTAGVEWAPVTSQHSVASLCFGW